MSNDSKVVIVTGGASGIGRHLAESFVRRGHRVIAADINEEALQQAAKEGGWDLKRVLLRRLDVRDPAAWNETLDLALATWERLDLLVNCAGYLRPGFIHQTGHSEVERHLDINAKGVIYGTQAAAARMVRQGSGHIINLASLAGLGPVPGLSLYAASKFAVRGFSLSIAHELRPHGVYITVICPDAVRTPMLDLQLDYPEAALTFSGGRILTVHDLEIVIFERVLPKRPLEVSLPLSRGLLLKVAALLPGPAGLVLPALRKKGLALQRAEKGNSRPG